MDANRFDDVIRSLSAGSSRRMVLGFALGGLVEAGHLENAAAKKGKKRKKKVKFNEFGCVNLGGFCKNDDHCCSGICEGKKDKRKCKAHDTGGCKAGGSRSFCPGGADVPCMTSEGRSGFCHTTTGNAGYCAIAGANVTCNTDKECQELIGPRAACATCPTTREFGTCVTAAEIGI